MTPTVRQAVPAAAESPGWWSPRPWLGMFLGGLGLWLAMVVVTFVTGNLNLVPTIILLGSFLVPVAFVGYAFGHADRVLTAQRSFTAVVSGGAGGLGAGGRLARPAVGAGRCGVGPIEEAVKLAVLWLVARRLGRYTMRAVRRC